MPSSYRRAGLVRRASLSQGCGFSCRGNFSGLAAESLSFLEGQALWQEGDRNGAVLAPACPLLLSVPSLPNLPARLGGLSRTDVPPESAAGAPGSGLMSAPSFPPSLLPALQLDAWVWSYPPCPSPKTTPSPGSCSFACGRYSPSPGVGGQCLPWMWGLGGPGRLLLLFI